MVFAALVSDWSGARADRDEAIAATPVGRLDNARRMRLLIGVVRRSNQRTNGGM